jgi:hypothetical protein
LVMYAGYVRFGSPTLLFGWPVAIIVGLTAQNFVADILPPRFEPYGGGNTWINLH